MTKIRFAQFVLNDIAANGMQMVDGWSSEYYVDARRVTEGRFDLFAASPKDKDSWSLWVGGWIFTSVTLQRGPERHVIELTREEKKAFVELDKAFKARQKENARLAREEKEARRVAAQDWP